MRWWHRAAAEARGGGDDSLKTGHNRLKKSVPGNCAAGYAPACWAAVY